MSDNQKILDDKKEKFKKLLRRRIEEKRDKLINESEIAINNKVAENRSEIKDAGIIIVAFNNSDSPFKYIRTEPLFYSKEKNFDVLLYGNRTIILISIKETVQGHNAMSHIKSLKEYQEDLEKNIDITDKTEGTRLKIIDFYKKLVGEIENKEFVLATQKPIVQIINEKAQELEYDFCLWKLVEKENKIFILNEIIKSGDESSFFGHRDNDLKSYLKKLATEGRVYNDPLTFILSSSKYLRATKISIPLSKMHQGFDFASWSQIFDVDLMNWHEVEKKSFYENYVNYGLECGFIKCLEDKDNISSNKYSIVSMYSKSSLLEKDIIKKMASFETKDNLREEVLKIKKQTKSEIISEQAKERGESLIKYINPNKEEASNNTSN